MNAAATYQGATQWHRLRQRVLDIDAPQTMDALSAEQFMAVAVARRTTDETVARASMVWTLLDMPRRDARTRAGFKLLSKLERYQLGALADPFMQPCAMVRTPLQEFSVEGGPLRIVHPDLFNEVDAETWGKADDCFLRFQRSADMDELRYMAAVLYQVGTPERAVRMRHHQPTIDAVNRLSDAQLLGIWQMWSCQRLVYEKESPMPFGKAQKKAKKRGWKLAMLDMSGRQFGDHATVLTTPVRDLFTLMHREMWAEQQAKLDAKAGKR